MINKQPATPGGSPDVMGAITEKGGDIAVEQSLGRTIHTGFPSGSRTGEHTCAIRGHKQFTRRIVGKRGRDTSRHSHLGGGENTHFASQPAAPQSRILGTDPQIAIAVYEGGIEFVELIATHPVRHHFDKIGGLAGYRC